MITEPACAVHPVATAARARVLDEGAPRMKLPRDLAGEEGCRARRRMGRNGIRQSGSHRRLARGADRATAPRRRALRAGTLQSMLHQAGITIEDLLEPL